MNNRQRGYLALANGRIFEGWAFGADPETAAKKGGEVVFNTSLSGYQEILTDPSYYGQIVVMTPSHIGNYGINESDGESATLHLSGFVVQEESAVYSNWRASQSLHDCLRKAGIPGLSGIDTRALTRMLRTEGAVNGIFSTDGSNPAALIKKAKALPGLENRDLTREVTAASAYEWTEASLPMPSDIKKEKVQDGAGKHVVVLDFGVKQNILRCLVDRGCRVTVMPAHSTCDDILKQKPDGLLISNGPGDPAAVKPGIQTLKQLIDVNGERNKAGQKLFAMFGICLGNQLLGLALGGETYKLKFGHHGANHPIKDLETGRVDITTQNHGFAVAAEKNQSGEWVVKGNKDAIVTHINLNDEAIEGLRHRTLPLFSVQYHPEASSGPHDAEHLFDRFIALMNRESSTVSN